MNPRPRARRRPTNAQRLEVDARNRALRTFVQGLAIDVAVAVAGLVYAITSDPSGTIVWGVIGASVLRTAVQSAAAYVMRKFVDGWKRVKTPLPPDPPGEPDADAPI